jgi:drug/metabolite transporter (DMT)-like permease
MAGYLIYEWEEIKKLKKWDWVSFGLVGLFGGVIGTFAITKAFFIVMEALQYNFELINLSVIILLQKLQPLFAIFFAIIILKEKPRKNFYLFGLIAILGSYFVTFGFNKPVFDIGSQIFLASIFAIIAAASWGSSTVFSKFAITKVNFRVGTYLRFGITTLIMAIILTFTNNWSGVAEALKLNLYTFLIIAFTTGGTAIFIYYYGLKRVSASVSTISEMMFPFVGVMMEYLVHGKILNLGQWFGAALLIGSIYLITRLKPIKSNVKV